MSDVSDIVFTTNETAIVAAFKNAADVADVTSADETLQTTYVAFIKMMHAKYGLHRGFIYLNRFLSYDLSEVTTVMIGELNMKLEEYINHVTAGDFASARDSHNNIVGKLDSSMFLIIPRLRDFNANDFTVAENTDSVVAQDISAEIDNTGEPIFVPPPASEGGP